jgi:hypothetical protein
MASRLHFYSDSELRRLAEEAGFASAKVVRQSLLPFAQQAGMPEEHLPFFLAAAVGGTRRHLSCYPQI